jgi:DNA-binding phage protein
MPILEREQFVRLVGIAVEEAGSQSALTKMTGVDRTTINKVLQGKRPPSGEIVKAFGLRVVFARGGRTLKRNDILRLLRSDIARAGSQTAWAKQAGIDRPMLNKMLRGKEQISKKVLLALNVGMVLVSDQRKSPAKI